MSVESFVNDAFTHILNALPAGAEFVAGCGIGYAFCRITTKEHRDVLKAQNAALQVSKAEITRKLEQRDSDERTTEKEHREKDAGYQATIEDLRGRLRTVRCHCGASMRRVREYQNPEMRSAMLVELKCSNEACGQDFEYDKDELKFMTKKLNGAG